MKLIDGDELIELLLSTAITDKQREYSECVQYAVNMMPTVDAVQVRHGRWIDIDSETYTWKIRCSKCGHERSMMSTGQTYPMYCEDCGARMDGKEGDNHG